MYQDKRGIYANRAAERRELEAEIGRLKETINELDGKLNRSPDWETFIRLRDEAEEWRDRAWWYWDCQDTFDHFWGWINPNEYRPDIRENRVNEFMATWEAAEAALRG